jgi:hypothetical protein
MSGYQGRKVSHSLYYCSRVIASLKYYDTHNILFTPSRWAANLWAWNAPRNGFPGSPKNQRVVEKNRAANKSPEHDVQKHATFYNSKSDESMRNAQLFFQETFWGNYGFDDPPLGVNTFEGHKWYVRVDGEVVKSFTIGKEKKQEFRI